MGLHYKTRLNDAIEPKKGATRERKRSIIFADSFMKHKNGTSRCYWLAPQNGPTVIWSNERVVDNEGYHSFLQHTAQIIHWLERHSRERRRTKKSSSGANASGKNELRVNVRTTKSLSFWFTIFVRVSALRRGNDVRATPLADKQWRMRVYFKLPNITTLNSENSIFFTVHL